MAESGATRNRHNSGYCRNVPQYGREKLVTLFPSPTPCFLPLWERQMFVRIIFYDFEKPGTLCVPSRIFRDIGIQHFKKNKTGTVPKKPGRMWFLNMPVWKDHAHTYTNRRAVLSLKYEKVRSSSSYWLTPWSSVLLEKLTGFQLVKKFLAFYGTRRFITALTSARHLSLSWASSIQSIPPHPTSWRPILILSSHLHLGLPSGLFPPGFPTKTLYTALPSPICATCPTHLIRVDFITCTILGEQNRSLSSSLCSFLHSHVTSSLSGPNILLNTLFSNTLSLRSSLSESDQVLHPYKTARQLKTSRSVSVRTRSSTAVLHSGPWRQVTWPDKPPPSVLSSSTRYAPQ